MTRVLLLAQFYPPIIGGEERHVRNLGQALAGRGHEVCVGTLRHEGAAASEWDGPVRVVRMRTSAQRFSRLFSDPGHAHAPPCPDPGATSALRDLVAAFRPDVVHTHNWFGQSYLPIRNAGGPPMLMTLHDYGMACPKKSLMRDGEPCPGPSLLRCAPCTARHYGRVKGSVTLAAHRMIGPGCSRFGANRYIAVSRAVAVGNGLPTGGLPYEVVPNFVPDTIGELPLIRDERLALLPEGPFILFVGDIRTIKGADVLLSAYAAMPDPLPLVLIGRRCVDGPSSLPLGAVAFEGWPHELVMHAWSRATLGVAPSLWPEPCATVVLEGMSMGQPMIVSDVGGMPDMIEHNVNGVVVPPGAAGRLADAMIGLIRDPSRRRRLGAAGRARVAAFTASQVVPRIEQAYGQLLASA